MADPDIILSRNADRLERLARGEAAQRARSRNRARTQASFARRFRRALMIAAALVLLPILYGLVIGPIGTTALVLLVLFGAMAIMGAFIWDGSAPSAQTIDAATIDVLPTVTDAWLHSKRRELPAAAGPKIDAISMHLATLEEQLARQTAPNDVTQDIDRLLKKHLPELIERYTKVPQAQRTGDPSLGATLVSSLTVVERELHRASLKLAEGDRDAVIIQGRFMEERYGEGDGPLR